MDKLHEESRKQFEEWVSLLYSGSNLLLRVGPNKESYHQTIVEGLWMAWQAARESIVVELPEQKEDKARNCSSDDIAYGFNQGVGACRYSLRSIGLSIKGE